MKVEVVRPHVFLDITIGGTKTGRIVLQLYDDLAPKAVQNFISLAQAGADGYRGSYFHRVIRNFVIQAGDVTYGMKPGDIGTKSGDIGTKSGDGTKHGDIYPDENVGKGGVSIYNDEAFEDENLSEPLDGPFKLCMANSGPNTNKSQFFITTHPQPHLNGKHTVFGKVVHGKSVVREIENVRTGDDNVPLAAEMVVIDDCGEWNEGDAVPIYNASYDQIGGDIYEEFPDDDVHIDKESSESVYHASCKIKDSGGLLFKAGEKQQAFFKYRKCLRYVMDYFPDQDQEPGWFAKYGELKKKLYLNLSLVCLQLKNYKKCIDYSTYLLEMKSELNQQELAKAHYRKGCGLLQTKKYKDALKDLSAAKDLMPADAAIAKEYEACEALIEKNKKAERAKYAKFFS